MSLIERLAELSDPRSRHGRRYPLVPLLTLCLLGILAGHTTVAAIAQFGRLPRHRLGHALGFRNGRMPCANTLSNTLRVIAAGDAGTFRADAGAGRVDSLPRGGIDGPPTLS
jgi:hypothetical protein